MTAADAFGDVDAVLVDLDGANLRACRDQRKASQGVAGILDPDLLVRTVHDAGHDIDGLLGARGDHDLFGLTPHGTRGPQIITNGPAQFQHAARVAIAEMLPSKRAQAACAEL